MKPLKLLLARTLLKPFWDFRLRIYWYNRFPKAQICFNQPNYPNLDISVGESTFGENIDILGNLGKKATIKIGSRTHIAPHSAIIMAHAHEIGHPDSSYIPPESITEIGNDVWIGYGTIILSGRKIGNNATIGAGSVITRNIRPYDIVAGNPAKSIKKKYPKSVARKFLLKSTRY